MKTQQLANTLESIVLKAYDGFSPHSMDWETRPAPDKWSKKEILGHLNDSAMNNIQRFVRVQHSDQTNISYEQDFWVQACNYQKQPFESIKELWKLNNLQIVNIWKNINDSLLTKTIPVKDEVRTLQFLMEDYIDHFNHHLNQIRS